MTLLLVMATVLALFGGRLHARRLRAARRLLLVMAAVLLLAAPAAAQYSWRPTADLDQADLWYVDRPVGCWRHDRQQYYPWDGLGYGAPQAPPLDPPLRNYGVDNHHFAGRERYTVSGRETSAEDARRLLQEGPSLPDDRGQPFWVVVGSEADCLRARATLATLPNTQANRIQLYRPDDAMIRDRSGKAMYAPGITLVTSAGTVLGHTDRFDSADDLSEGLRRLDPSFDQKLIPSLKNRAVARMVGPLVPHLALLGGGLVLCAGTGLVALSRRKKP